MQRPLPGGRTGPVEADFCDPQWAKSLPALTEYLTATKYDGGQGRVTSTLLLFLENGVLRLCLNDRDNNRSTFMSGETVDMALHALDAALSSDTADWRTRSNHRTGEARPPF